MIIIASVVREYCVSHCCGLIAVTPWVAAIRPQ